MPTFRDTNRSPFVTQNNPPQGLNPGVATIANFVIPVGQTYLASVLGFFAAGVKLTKAQMISMIDYIQVLVNGVEVANLSAAEWIALANFYNTNQNGAAVPNAGAVGFLPIFWERNWMAELVNQRSFAYGMVGENSFQFNIAMNATNTVDSITLCHRVANGAEPLGRHVEIRKQNATFNSLGQFNIIDLPQKDYSSNPDAIAAIHLETDVTKISQLIVRADQVELWRGTPDQLQYLYHFANDARTPQTGFLSLDFLNRGWLSDQLPDNMSQLEVIPTFVTTAPGSFPILIELITGRAGATQGAA
jgi:hypothetical protein